MHTIYQTECFTTLHCFKMCCVHKCPENLYLFVPCDGFVHCCPLLKPPEKYLETTRINYFNKERTLYKLHTITCRLSTVVYINTFKR